MILDDKWSFKEKKQFSSNKKKRTRQSLVLQQQKWFTFTKEELESIAFIRSFTLVKSI